MLFQPGTWRTQTDLIDPTPGGWGLAPATYGSFWFRFAALLFPVWFPFLLGLLIGRGAADFGLFIVLLFFIFIPGVYFVANTPNWGKLARASASLGYVAAAEVIAYVALRAGSQVSGG